MAPWLWSILELWVFHGILVFPWKNGGAKDLKKRVSQPHDGSIQGMARFSCAEMMDLQCFSCFLVCGELSVVVRCCADFHMFLRDQQLLSQICPCFAPTWGSIGQDGPVRRDRRFPPGLGRTLRGGKEANMCPWKIRQLCTFVIICLELGQNFFTAQRCVW